jgi:hypothetical protein
MGRVDADQSVRGFRVERKAFLVRPARNSNLDAFQHKLIMADWMKFWPEMSGPRRMDRGQVMLPVAEAPSAVKSGRSRCYSRSHGLQ